MDAEEKAPEQPRKKDTHIVPYGDEEPPHQLWGLACGCGPERHKHFPDIVVHRPFATVAN